MPLTLPIRDLVVGRRVVEQSETVLDAVGVPPGFLDALTDAREVLGVFGVVFLNLREDLLHGVRAV